MGDGMSTTHDLKCWPEPFQAIVDGDKRFEFRKDDRGYAIGDILRLREWGPDTKDYTGWSVLREVTYIAAGGFGIPPGYCVMSIAGPEDEE